MIKHNTLTQQAAQSFIAVGWRIVLLGVRDQLVDLNADHQTGRLSDNLPLAFSAKP